MNQQTELIDKLSDRQILEAFPEAKEIIPKKIAELTFQKQSIYNDEILPILTKISQEDDEFSRKFWLMVLVKMLIPEEYKIASENLTRLHRLQNLLNPKKMKAEENFQEKIKQAKNVKIIDLFNFKKVRKLGDRYHVCCPFHDDSTPSMVIYPDNHFYCFGCHANGDSIDFQSLLDKSSFIEAINDLAGTIGGGR